MTRPDPDQERFRSNILAVVSHELNTPLMGILNSLQILEERFPQEKEYLPMLRRNAERLRTCIQNVLELSRADAGALRVRLTEVDIENLVYLHRDLLKDELATLGFGLDLHVEADIPRVCADPRRLGKVLEALIRNAIKFSVSPIPGEQPEVRVSVSLEPVSQVPQEYFAQGKERKTGLYLIVSVASSLRSIGERPESFEQLFEPFAPWRDVDVRPREGMGLELAIAREVLMAHGGFIWAEDSRISGEGWVVCLALPVLSREEELDLIIHNRLVSGLGVLSKVSLFLLKPHVDSAFDPSLLGKLAEEVQSLLFRSSDSLFVVPETGEITVLMDDCDERGAVIVGSRLAAHIKQKLPNVEFVWSVATGPDHGVSAEMLLKHARTNSKNS